MDEIHDQAMRRAKITIAKRMCMSTAKVRISNLSLESEFI